MEKLLALLNEYDGTPTEWKQIGDKIYFDGLGGNSELHELIIISKYYGFIQRLVDNDKIENDLKEIKVCLKKGNELIEFEGGIDELLIMTLSISETPIEDLISYLK